MHYSMLKQMKEQNSLLESLYWRLNVMEWEDIHFSHR